ncbi:DUF4861 family protein [Asticcacaulis sp. YBE204]|uniref:DUF4861 family protein n=1 Tax=Asticcacaulis sp. YBE204 TaxID=1282363 RepID=UPI0003C3BFEC|nr:DUF4861 family protein [Asticcacaulis sp. YBE204]ESQ81383.1 hypothetical protein AEYBE204_03300 [Asticcacaulis sp. YBE204]
MKAVMLAGALLAAGSAQARDADPWYTQREFVPVERVEIRLHNPLNTPRLNSPVIIPRAAVPQLHHTHELWMTLVDPSKPGIGVPDAKTRAREGPHGRLEETNGHAIDYQFDDLDQDGLWDELFLMTDFAPNETKVIYVYFGKQMRGWNPHRTHAATGSYMRHTVPFWESENIGWKLWFPDAADVYGKRKPQLMSNRLYGENLDGYAVSLIDPGLGSDIMSVDDSFGGGGIAVMDDPKDANAVSRARFTPGANFDGRFNGDPTKDTRYAYTVLANGPLRSMVRVRILNWDSGHGRYAADQVYTAYAGEDYATATVQFTEFAPKASARFVAGIRKHGGQTFFRQSGGMVVTAGPEVIRNPDDVEALQPDMKVDFAGAALVVKDRYKPRYLFSEARQGNHLMVIEPTADRRFEYLIAAGWSEGAQRKTAEAFGDYVARVAREYNAPIEVKGAVLEKK